MYWVQYRVLTPHKSSRCSVVYSLEERCNSQTRVGAKPDVDLGELMEIITAPGRGKLAAKYWSDGGEEKLSGLLSVESPRVLPVCNAPSPGATAFLEIN